MADDSATLAFKAPTNISSATNRSRDWSKNQAKSYQMHMERWDDCSSPTGGLSSTQESLTLHKAAWYPLPMKSRSSRLLRSLVALDGPVYQLRQLQRDRQRDEERKQHGGDQ